jgi:hypothetical protein
MRLGRAFLIPLIALGGCADRAAPDLAVAGAYFPAWMICGLIGIFAAIGARVIFVVTNVVGVLPLQLFVCTAIGIGFAVFAWLFWFGQ